MLNLEWFTVSNFAESYRRAKQDKKMLVFKRSKQVVADFGDRKNKIANPLIEVYGPEGLLIISRIVNFQHELRQVAQDVPVTLVLEKDTLAKLTSIKDFLEAKNA